MKRKLTWCRPITSTVVSSRGPFMRTTGIPSRMLRPMWSLALMKNPRDRGESHTSWSGSVLSGIVPMVPSIVAMKWAWLVRTDLTFPVDPLVRFRNASYSSALASDSSRKRSASGRPRARRRSSDAHNWFGLSSSVIRRTAPAKSVDTSARRKRSLSVISSFTCDCTSRVAMSVSDISCCTGMRATVAPAAKAPK